MMIYVMYNELHDINQLYNHCLANSFTIDLLMLKMVFVLMLYSTESFLGQDRKLAYFIIKVLNLFERVHEVKRGTFSPLLVFHFWWNGSYSFYWCFVFTARLFLFGMYI